MAIAQYLVFFTFYSFLGWVWETIYCTIVKGRFQNRGFLYGPICPIYGTSVVIAQILFRWAEGVYGGPLPLLQVFLICMIGSALIEFSTSWYLEQRFHARWWDYSHLPFNIQGRICVPVSIAFGMAGIFVVRYLLPWMLELESMVNPIVFELFSVIFAALIGADFALTEANLSTLLQRMNEAEQAFTDRGEAAYQTVTSAPAELKSRATAAGEKVAEKVVEALPDLPSIPDLPSLPGAATRDAAADRLAEIAESLTWWQERQLRRMTGFAPLSAGARLKNALSNRKTHRNSTR